MNVIITGTTGMVGMGVLLECLDDPDIKKVLVINRRKLDMQHRKLEEKIIPDFNEIDSLKGSLGGYDACFHCMGISSIGMKEEEYTRITYHITMKLAKAYLADNPKGSMTYVSGTGTDSSETGRSMWARVKGKTENDLLGMPFEKAHMFRPGYIQPLRGVKSKTPWVNTTYAIFKPIYLILKYFPGSATNSSNIGKAMIYCIKETVEENILGNRLINFYALKYQP